MSPPSKSHPNHAIFSTAEWSRLARDLGLAQREVYVAKAMIDEKNDAQIASELGATEADVAVHIADVLRKTHAGSSVTLLLCLLNVLRRTSETRPRTL